MNNAWLRNTFRRQGVALAHPDHARDHDRVANILNDIQGIGCRIEKPRHADGRGWLVIVDGSSDISDSDFKLPGDSDVVKCTENDTCADYLHAKLEDSGTYVSAEDMLVKAETQNAGNYETERLFVDISAISGYNGSNTQVLGHESGTLKWFNTCPPVGS